MLLHDTFVRISFHPAILFGHEHTNRINNEQTNFAFEEDEIRRNAIRYIFFYTQ